MIDDDDEIPRFDYPIMSEIAFDEMRLVAENLRAYGEDMCYGLFPGGDPNDFTPDPECCTAEEAERHRLACEQWNAGNHTPVGPPMVAFDAPTPDGAEFVSSLQYTGKTGITTGHKHVSYFGLGSYTMTDPEMLKLAQDLDDWLDRARQII